MRFSLKYIFYLLLFPHLQQYHGERELFMSDHKDTVLSACIISKCTVWSIDDYRVRTLSLLVENNNIHDFIKENLLGKTSFFHRPAKKKFVN